MKNRIKEFTILNLIDHSLIVQLPLLTQKKVLKGLGSFFFFSHWLRIAFGSLNSSPSLFSPLQRRGFFLLSSIRYGVGKRQPPDLLIKQMKSESTNPLMQKSQPSKGWHDSNFSRLFLRMERFNDRCSRGFPWWGTREHLAQPPRSLPCWGITGGQCPPLTATAINQGEFIG